MQNLIKSIANAEKIAEVIKLLFQSQIFVSKSMINQIILEFNLKKETIKIKQINQKILPDKKKKNKFQ